MKPIARFESKRWGPVTVMRGTYESANGPTAIVLSTPDGPLATVSVNMYQPECTQDSRRLPKDCFYVKTWSENEELVDELLASGLFKVRDDLPASSSGFVTAPVWQLVEREVVHG